ncbi:MAG TPA: glycosyl hydrolase family 18 protein, partial [Spirochaetota bacterium]
GTKILSVALRPTTRISEDPYDYGEIGKIADRVLIMAYDEHWSTSEPGPIASLGWCKKVAACVTEKIPDGKAVMGVPFYGRAWQDETFARALKYWMIEDLAKKEGLEPLRSDYPSFTYDEKVKVTVFFENKSSLIEKLSMYHEMGIRSVGFWRIGQNPKDIWQYLSVEGAK